MQKMRLNKIKYKRDGILLGSETRAIKSLPNDLKQLPETREKKEILRKSR